MGESLHLQAYQSSTLLPQVPSHRFTDHSSYVRFLSIRSALPAGFSRSISSQRHQQNRFSTWTGARVVSGSKAPTLIFESTGGEDTDIQADIGGGGGLGGEEGRGGGGGGGGGGDNSGGGSGESDNSEKKKKMAMSLSQKFTLGYAALVGVGGLMGYLKSGSGKSLAAGGISTALLGYVYMELPARPTLASAIGLGVSVVLLGVMGSRFKNSGKVFPAGVVSAMSLIMSAGYIHGMMRSGTH